MREAEGNIYRTHGEVVQDLVKAAAEEIQIVGDFKLGNVVGDSLADARPRLAPFWRSGLALASIAANIDGVAALGAVVAAILPEADAEMGGALAFELSRARDAVAWLADENRPLAEILAEPDEPPPPRLRPLSAGRRLPHSRSTHPRGPRPHARLQLARRRLTMQSRRHVLAMIGAAGLTPLATLARAGTDPAYIAARMNADGSFAAVVFDAEGHDLFTEELDARGHDIAVSPDRRLAVMFARRPGRFAIVLDLTRGRRVAAFASPADRHFYGHGFFGADGRLLYATENDFEDERGLLGVYDAATWTRIGEIETGAVGPHEAVLLADGRTVACANGGVATHPDYPRQKLNLPFMKPSVSYVDIETGDLLASAELPAYSQLSIRHITQAGDCAIWFGGQYEGPKTDVVPLVGRHRPGEAIEMVEVPDAYASMASYIGAVETSADGTRIAASSPRGGKVMVFDAASRDLVSTLTAPDVCAIAPSQGNAFLAADGAGTVWDGTARLAQAGGRWDNHVVALDPRPRDRSL